MEDMVENSKFLRVQVRVWATSILTLWQKLVLILLQNIKTVMDYFETFLMTVLLSYSSLDWPELSQKYNCRSLDPPICALL